MNYIGIVLIILGGFILICNISISINNGKGKIKKTDKSDMLITAIDSICLAVGIGILHFRTLPLVTLIIAVLGAVIIPPWLHYLAYTLTIKIIKNQITNQST